MKRLFKYLILILLFVAVPVNAYQVKECDRSDMENYGVNKKWQITTSNLKNVMDTHCIADTKAKIYDFSDVLTKEEEDKLREEMNEFITKYKTDLVIVIDSLAYSYDSMNETYAADFYDYNDFGKDYPLYDGILLFRNTYELDPYYDMYTFGNAQLYFTQDRYDYILDGIYSDLHAGNYYNGFSRYIKYVTRYYSEGKPGQANNYYIDENGYAQEREWGFSDSETTKAFPYGGMAIGSGIVTLIIVSIMAAKNKMVKKAVTANEYLVKSSINYTERRDDFVSSHTTSWTESDSSSGGGGGGGFHSSGGSSGGGHSSGGGRHG